MRSYAQIATLLPWAAGSIVVNRRPVHINQPRVAVLSIAQGLEPFGPLHHHRL